MVLSILKQVAKSIITALLTEAFIKEMVIFLLEKLAQRSDNKVDDEIVARIKNALQQKES